MILKTYPDGSQLTTKHAAWFGVCSVIYVGALAYGIEKWNNRPLRENRSNWLKKFS